VPALTNEIAIRGGMLIDGTGAPPRRADLGIAAGRVVEIDTRVTAPHEIDASGRLVVPGFLDIHTHYDPQVLWDPDLTPSSWHGVTSVVAGNCGYSIAPNRPGGRGTLLRTLDKVEDMRLATLEAGIDWDFESYGEYLDRIGERGTAIHFGGFVGHTAVRICVMDQDAYEREATNAEIDQMKQLVAESIRAGALGFSSDRAGFHIGDGGRPVPSIAASQAETEALMRVTAEIGQGIVHIAPADNSAWLYDFQPRLGRTINWSSILVFPPELGRDHLGQLAQQEQARAAGLDIWAQVTCRPIVQQISMAEPTAFYGLSSFASFVAASDSERPALYADAGWRARVWAEFNGGARVSPRWNTFLVQESDTHPELCGRSVEAIAAERGCTPFDVICDVALEDALTTRFNVTFANDDEDAVRKLLLGDGCIMGLSDAGAHVGQICDAVMPTDFLSGWVRDRELMPVERGIHKLTGEIAAVLGLDRGSLRTGAAADVVVLDWDGLSPGPIRRVHDMPANGDRLVADAPTGIDWVLVDGVAIRAEGKPCTENLDRLPGALLRSAPD
jgi:N-acyl-D-aspartate/D-glutamate deacylase